ncbi:hypothetical protein [Oceanithermus desulfurans]|uniref:Uncharacterized protein n=2 Tax=Oceanithermus desulfurans TaxID=227924 RepID=A0A511RL25_9DEIN|nr:hypothetical protein [Oceanithermus desulfurans]MBB6030713.1 peptidoglycan/LPS O-acetylase OafA/YrhL [Oceanithermus desulfurans]GEM90358.1 hypothetical protein ODE01S_17920 [Oceanithermus desulfurans NBRC 100063]
MLEGLVTGLVLGAWILMALAKATGRDVSRWRAANLPLAALAAALGLTLTYAFLPAPWWPQARGLAVGSLMLWLGWCTARHPAQKDPGCASWVGSSRRRVWASWRGCSGAEAWDRSP